MFSKVRPATPDDAGMMLIMNQYGKQSIDQDGLLCDLYQIMHAIARNDVIGLVAEDHKGCMKAYCIAFVDSEQALARLYAFGSHPDSHRNEILMHLLQYLETACIKRNVEVLYTTTQALTLKEQSQTLDWGYQLMGISPGAVFLDQSRLNGITAKFFSHVLSNKRVGDYALHPALEEFYQVVRQQLKLDKLPIDLSFAQTVTTMKNTEKVPALELIDAPKFVKKRYETILADRFLTSNFYPFQTPDHMLVDEDQKIEVFFRTFSKLKFATLISEHINTAINPVDLYKSVVKLLYQNGVSYLELINEASDVYGTQIILEAGFVPCGFFPALRKQDQTRRDYVVFSRCLERISELDRDLPKPYYEYLRHYHEWETSQILG